ncbi:MAG: hypothetical protein ACXVXI_06990, partial [Mycobacteriaceae bacterium]
RTELHAGSAVATRSDSPVITHSSRGFAVHHDHAAAPRCAPGSEVPHRHRYVNVDGGDHFGPTLQM